MMAKFITIIMVFIGLSTFFYSCSRSNLEINSTTHQKYVISESEIETKIQVYIDEVPDDVTFDSLIFNRQEVPVSIQETEHGVILTGIIHSGRRSGKFEQEQKFVDKPNQLNYTINGKSDYILLSNVHFLPSKIAL